MFRVFDIPQGAEAEFLLYETLVSPTDLTPVLEALEVMQQSLDKANAGLATEQKPAFSKTSSFSPPHDFS